MLTAILVLVAGCARAGASLLVDDASLTPPDQCQIESWGREYTVGSELTTVPACTQSGTEYSLGLSRFTRAADGVVLSPGIKRNFRDIDGHAWGWALSFGSSWSSRPGRLNNWSLNAPVTISLDAAACQPGLRQAAGGTGRTVRWRRSRTCRDKKGEPAGRSLSGSKWSVCRTGMALQHR
jgi:hypothetical protein